MQTAEGFFAKRVDDGTQVFIKVYKPSDYKLAKEEVKTQSMHEILSCVLDSFWCSHDLQMPHARPNPSLQMAIYDKLGKPLHENIVALHEWKEIQGK